MKTFPTVLCGLLLTTGLALAAQGAGQHSFSSLDKNGDGKLSKKEAMADPAITAPAFAAADGNHDGYLSPQEFQAIAAMSGINQKSGTAYRNTTQPGTTGQSGTWQGTTGRSNSGQNGEQATRRIIGLYCADFSFHTSGGVRYENPSQ